MSPFRIFLAAPVWFVLATLTLAVPVAAKAQVTPAPTAGLETATAPQGAPLQEPQPLAPPQYFQLPPLEKIQRSPQAYGVNGAPSVVLKTIEVTPTSLLTPEEIKRVTSVYIGVPVTLEDVEGLRDALTEMIVAKGYINSGAVLPDQDISSGKLSITIVEGRLSRVEVTGTKYLNQAYLVQRLKIDPNRPLSAAELQTAYQLLLQDRNISHLNARLVPGDKPGEAVFDIDTTEQPRYGWSTFLASDRSPAVGDTRGGLSGHFASLVLPGDDVSGEIGRTSGMTDEALSYSAPLTSQNLMLNLQVQGANAKILAHPFNALDAISDSLYESVGLSYPLIVEPGRSLILASEIDHIRVRTALLGEDFSFSPGAVDGITEYTTSRTTLTYSYVSNLSSYVVSLTGSKGLLGNRLATGVDRYFGYLDLSGSYIRRVNDENHRLVLKGAIRASHEALYATEMFVIGGGDTVRGYRQNALLGTSGYWASAEYQVPMVSVIHLKAQVPSYIAPSTLMIGAFIDAGHVDAYASPAAGGPRELAAVGLHARWTPTARFDVDMYFAAHLRKSEYSGSYQDQGFGFATHFKF